VRRLFLLLVPLAGVLAAVPAWAASETPAETPVATVDIVKVQGIVDPTLVGFVTDELADAASRRSTVILQIDSDGTYGDLARTLGRRIREATVPVVAWVGPIGARL